MLTYCHQILKLNWHHYNYLFFYCISLSPTQLAMNIAYFTRKWPKHSYNGHLQRTINLIQSLVNMSNKVVVCSDDENINGKDEIKDYPIDLLDISPNKIANSINNLTKLSFKPQIFLFDSVESEEKYSAFLYNRWNKCPRVLDMQQLKGLQKWRKSTYKMIPNSLIPSGSEMSPQNIDKIFTSEQTRAISRSDYILTSNQHNYHLINNHLLDKKGDKYISNINYSFPLEQFYAETTRLEFRPFRNRKNFVFIGSSEKQSNVDSLHELVSFIWPKIREKLPQCQLHVWSSNIGGFFAKGEDFTKEKLKNKGVVFKGNLQQSEKLSQYKALLYPAVFSTGPHIKIIQSWFMHLPIVTTPIGAQSVFLESYDPSLSIPEENNSGQTFSSERVYTEQQRKKSEKIRNYYSNRLLTKNTGFTFGGSFENFTRNDFVENSIKMYTDEQYWDKCLSNGHKIIKKNYNEQHIEVLLKKALVKIEIAAYEGRGRQSYEAQWKRYTKSQQFNKKLRG